MTAEKYLAAMYSLINCMNDEDKEFTNKLIDMGLTGTETFTGISAEAAAIVNNLKIDILEKAQKASGKNKQISACKAILKTAPKSKPLLHYQHITADGMQIICNDHAIVVYAPEDRVLLEEKPDNIEGEYPDWQNYMKNAKANLGEQLEKPDPSKLKVYIKDEKIKMGRKQNKRIFFDFGDDMPYVNAEMLSYMLEALPNAEIFPSTHKAIGYTRLYFRSNHSEGILCGVYPPKDIVRIRTKL